MCGKRFTATLMMMRAKTLHMFNIVLNTAKGLLFPSLANHEMTDMMVKERKKQ
jgi:hypothetical protein